MTPKFQHNPKSLLTSLVLVFPLFLIYQLGVLFTLPMLNGVDFVTLFLFQYLHLSYPSYLAFTGAVALLFALGVGFLRRKQNFNPKMIIPVLLESAIYALTMGSLIILVMTNVFGISPRLAGGFIAEQGFISRLVMSIGAGVYEETVFRLGLLSGLVVLLERAAGLRRPVAILVAFLVSAFAFSAMHHIPPYGDPLRIGIFMFRFLAGLWFGLLYWFRGFAVAVYTHALYDVYVLVIH